MDNEIKQVYYEDLIDKNSIARSSRVAYQTKSHLRNKQDQIKLKRGRPKMIKFNYNEYIPYKKFKELPKDLKANYLQYMVDEYHIWISQVVRMWGGEVAEMTLRRRFEELGIVRSIPEGVHPKEADKERFFNAYRKPSKIKTRAEVSESEESEESEVPQKTPKYCNFVENIDGSLTFRYTKDDTLKRLTDSFANFLSMFPNDQDYDVQVLVRRRS